MYKFCVTVCLLLFNQGIIDRPVLYFQDKYLLFSNEYIFFRPENVGSIPISNMFLCEKMFWHQKNNKKTSKVGIPSSNVCLYTERYPSMLHSGYFLYLVVLV